MFEKIKSIKKTKMKDVYDIEMVNLGFQGNKNVDKSNFIANNIVCKNSGGDARASFSLLDTFSEYEEARKFQEKYPLATEIAIKLEGHVRHRAIHAAALVLTGNPIAEYLPLNKINGEIATEWEKQLVEDMKLTKLDILGLKVLTIISECMKSINQKLPTDFEDKKVYDTVFINGKTLGVFQFESVGLSKLSKELKVSDFSTLYDATTLYRPGCVSGDTRILKNNFPRLFIESKIKNLTKHLRLDLLEYNNYKVKNRKGSSFYSGQKELFRIETEDGNFIDISAEHKIMTNKGMKKVKDLKDSDELMEVIPENEIDYIECKVCGDIK